MNTTHEQMNNNDLYRIGTPRITETTDRFDCGRGTGGMGTGLYAYRTQQAAENSYAHRENGTPMHRLKNICKHPLHLKTEQDTWRLNDAGRYMRCDKTFSAAWELMRIPAIRLAASNIDIDELIQTSVHKEKACRTKDGELFHGSRTCSHAINHLLDELGFDCVLPDPRAGGDSNEYGSVILRETLERELGRKLWGYQDIPDFGEIINDEKTML